LSEILPVICKFIRSSNPS